MKLISIVLLLLTTGCVTQLEKRVERLELENYKLKYNVYYMANHLKSDLCMYKYLHCTEEHKYHPELCKGEANECYRGYRSVEQSVMRGN